jgi:hypothetical protein
MNRCKVLIAFTILAVGSMATSASERPLNLGTDVVLSDDGKTVFYRDEEGRAHARDVSEGRLKWSTTVPTRPISVLGAQLLVQLESSAPGEATLRWLNATSGAPGKTLTLALAEDVVAHLNPMAESQFDWMPEISAGEMLVHWRYSLQPSRGALMIDAEAESITRSGASALKLGATTAVARINANPPNGMVYALDPNERLAGLGERQFRSADDEHVLVSESLPDAQFASRYRWRIFSQSGVAVGEYESLQAFTPFLVSDNVLLLRASPFVRRAADGQIESAPERLLAVDLKTSAVRWTVTILDPVYRGALPP